MRSREPGDRTWPPSRSPIGTAPAPAATHDAAPSTGAVPTSRAVYWRRRLVVALLGVVLVLVMAQAGAALGGSTLAAPERRPAVSPHVTTITVRPGDSLWSIAQRLAPGEDPARSSTRSSRPATASRSQPGETIEWAG